MLRIYEYPLLSAATGGRKMEAVRRAFCVILLSVFAGTAGATAASAATPTAGAEPQPEKLWEAFPLNPRPAKPQATRKRPSKPLVGVGGLPAKQAPGARRDSPGTNVAGEPGGGAAEKSSGGDDKSVVKIVLIALGAAQFVLLALLLVMFWPELKSFGHRVRRAWHWVARRLPDIAWEPRFVPAGLKDRLLRRGDRDAYFAPRPTWPLE